MDLRPRIAADIVDALLADIRLDLPPEKKARLVELALTKIESHSIPFKKSWDYGSDEPDVIEAFLTKYPKLRQIVADTQAKARELWPDADQILELNNNPEGCHTCHEGQSLHLEIRRKQDFIPDDPKAAAFDEWWLDYPDAFGPTRDPVFDLFLPMPGFALKGESS
jgi:hypothetical protein